MSAQVEDGRFTLTDEDGNGLTVTPGTMRCDVWRITMTNVPGSTPLVFAAPEEMRALRDYLNTVLP